MAATRKRGSRTQGLDAALEALEAGNDEAALEALLVAWRASRVHEIAQLVETVSRRIEARLPPVHDHREGTGDYWMTVARRRRPADLPRLLTEIPHRRSAPAGPVRRIAELGKWPHDPRITPGVVWLLRRSATVTTIAHTCAYLGALVELALAQDDPGTLAAFEQFASGIDRILQPTTRAAVRQFLEQQVAAALDRLRARTRQRSRRLVSAADARLAAAVKRWLERDQAPDDALFAEIVERPEDDDLRHVLADRLLERGDPRGEFISLQLSGADPEREHALLEHYEQTWLGPLAEVVGESDCGFAGGFPVEASLSSDATAIASRVIGDPTWATIESLGLGFRDTLPTELLQHPVMRVQHLREVSRDAMVELLGWQRIPYVSIEASFPDHRTRARREDVRLLLSAQPALAKLRVLTLDGAGTEPEQFRWIWKSWLAKQLDRLEFQYGLQRIDRWLVELNRYAKRVREVRLGGQQLSAGWLALTRDAKHRFSIADVHTPMSADPRAEDLAYSVVGSYIAALPRGTFTRLRIHDRMPRPKYRRVLEAACARAQLPLELPPEQRKRRR